MKTIVFLIFLFSMGSLFAQDGFKLIYKAECQIEKGNLDKAMKLLIKADSMNYGFCGNAWIEARSSIALNKAKIMNAQGESLKAANLINNSSFMSSNQDVDSLKIAYYLETIEKQLIKREFDSCINEIKSMDQINFFEGIAFNVKFSENPFVLSLESFNEIFRSYRLNFNDKSEDEKLSLFKEIIREQPFYRLLN